MRGECRQLNVAGGGNVALLFAEDYWVCEDNFVNLYT